jgi:hypothetical protein
MLPHIQHPSVFCFVVLSAALVFLPSEASKVTFFLLSAAVFDLVLSVTLVFFLMADAFFFDGSVLNTVIFSQLVFDELVEFINQSTNSSKIRRNLCTPSPSKSVTKVPVCFRFNLINYVCYTCEFDCTGGILSLYSLFLLNFRIW